MSHVYIPGEELQWPIQLHRCQHGLRKMRESARNDISRTHANFTRVHKCEQNASYSYMLSHFIKCRFFCKQYI